MMIGPMTEPHDRTDPPTTASPPDDLEFEVETETMPDGREIHYYHWPEPEPPTDDV